MRDAVTHYAYFGRGEHLEPPHRDNCPAVRPELPCPIHIRPCQYSIAPQGCARLAMPKSDDVISAVCVWFRWTCHGGDSSGSVTDLAGRMPRRSERFLCRRVCAPAPGCGFSVKVIRGGPPASGPTVSAPSSTVTGADADHHGRLDQPDVPGKTPQAGASELNWMPASFHPSGSSIHT